MKFPQDIDAYIIRVFGKKKSEKVVEILRQAKLHDGRSPSDRLVRCMLIASEGTIEGLARSARLLETDFRDVIMCGEYELENGQSVRVRDLDLPFSERAN